MAQLVDIESLIARVALGDRKAFSTLYDQTSAKLFGVALRVLNNRASAEDVLQETYMKIWRRADRYASNGMSPMSWLIAIARNTAIDRLRATRDSANLDDVSNHLVASGPTPEQSVVAAGEAARITECLGKLEAEKGQAVRGAYLQGLSYAELAEKFSVPLNTMRTWLRRSLISLKECMEQ
ncbi:hypothetical protein P775_03820 [Puniceibacterium antarcticum]|uniref:RNA polymerase sigma factor n=1 Tax=Puniceibacterium antarcticum TaxID=1206336 RepID=A0A2G8RJ85_9RHOB|nr:sigma-70 family RNA polymerase sigma factor [Puniceibacterium antarcticum]PIL21562.1 hypothetical protein P775_03820 [Puniceibacterium antarcticum]